MHDKPNHTNVHTSRIIFVLLKTAMWSKFEMSVFSSLWIFSRLILYGSIIFYIYGLVQAGSIISDVYSEDLLSIKYH